MLKRNTREESSVRNAAVLYRYAGVLLVWLGLSSNPVFAISMSPDALENSMNVLSLSGDCAGENISDHRLVCQDTLADIAKSHAADKIAGKMTNIGMNQLGKITGKFGMKSVSLATKGAMRALGQTGKVITSWEFGRRIETELSDQLITPSIEQYHQKKGREENEKIRQHTELLKGNKTVAVEYRKLLMERGWDEANAYLDKQFRVAGEPDESTYDVQNELDRMKEIQQQAESMDEDAARQRNIEREAQNELLSGDGESPAEGEPGESENLLSMADGDVSDTGFDAAEEVSEIDDTEATLMAPDTGTEEFDDRRSSTEDELVDIANEQLEGGIGNQRDTDSNLQSGDGEEMEKQADSDAQQYAGEMVAVPAGSFRMGDLSGDRSFWEKPVHSVTVPAFSMGKYEVTVGQFRRFVEATGYRTEAERNAGGYQGCFIYTSERWEYTAGASWRNPGFSVGDNYPAVCVSWNDAEAFVKWLNGEAGGDFRLPTEAEWEYAVRAGSNTRYHFGNDEAQLCRYGNHLDSGTDFNWRNESCSDGVGEHTVEVGRYEPNSFGLYDMHGNVLEWVADCWNDSYVGAPSDGSAWTSGDCGQRMSRGGSWYSNVWALRSAARRWLTRSTRDASLGFRLAQDK